MRNVESISMFFAVIVFWWNEVLKMCTFHSNFFIQMHKMKYFLRVARSKIVEKHCFCLFKFNGILNPSKIDFGWGSSNGINDFWELVFFKNGPIWNWKCQPTIKQMVFWTCFYENTNLLQFLMWNIEWISMISDNEKHGFDFGGIANDAGKAI